MWVRFPLTRIKRQQTLIFSKHTPAPNLIFNFTFVSLFTPIFLIRSNLNYDNFAKLNRKLALKQSYLFLTWFYYLETLKFKQDGEKKKIRFFILPVRKQIYTLTKAPIAHKTWSREQYKFQFYNIRISFNDIIFDEPFDNSFNQTLLFFLMVGKAMPNYETNLMLVKSFRLLLNLYEPLFFNYNAC